MSAGSDAMARRANLMIAPRKAGHPDDAELVRGLAAGEAWAAPAVWHKHAPKVFRVVGRVLGPGGDAEDITQDVFERVFSRVGGLRDPNALGSFVLSIAIRTLKWELRRRRVRRILQLTDSGELPEQVVPALDAEARQALRRLYAILDTLKVDERTAFILRHMEGMSLPEVAEAIGVSLATVKRRLSRAAETVSALVDRDPAIAAYCTRREEANDDS